MVNSSLFSNCWSTLWILHALHLVFSSILLPFFWWFHCSLSPLPEARRKNVKFKWIENDFEIYFKDKERKLKMWSKIRPGDFQWLHPAILIPFKVLLMEFWNKKTVQLYYIPSSWKTGRKKRYVKSSYTKFSKTKMKVVFRIDQCLTKVTFISCTVQWLMF